MRATQARLNPSGGVQVAWAGHHPEATADVKLL